MATPAEIQAQLDSANTKHVAEIIQSISIDGTYDSHYVVGITDPYSGRSRWCQTTTAETAANQAAEIIAVLVA